jgi:hypothetical protein
MAGGTGRVMQRFSQRLGHAHADTEIRYRNDAPAELREALPQIAVEVGLGPSELRAVVCGVLRKRENPQNWSDYPNVWNEVNELVDEAPWYQVYDVAEAIYEYLRERQHRAAASADKAGEFEAELNATFHEYGIGWQMDRGELKARGAEAYQAVVEGAIDALADQARTTASGELLEAQRDLSRRPEPDITGAIQHAVAALECVAREYTGDRKATLGKLLNDYPDLFPKPIRDAVEKVWGYASELGRHLREGREPGFREAQLAVGMASVAANYLIAHQPQRQS